MVSDTREVLDSAASDENNTMLLEVVTDSRDVCCYFNTIGQTNSGDLTKSRVRLFGVTVLTEVHTPRFCGELTFVATLLREFIPLFSAGAVDFFSLLVLP